MTSERCPVRAILMQNKCLFKSLSWTQFLNFNQFLFYDLTHKISNATELLSRMFTILKQELLDKFSKNIFLKIFKQYSAFGKNEICYKTHPAKLDFKIQA